MNEKPEQDGEQNQMNRKMATAVIEMVALIEQSALDANFGGLAAIPEHHAQQIVDLWATLLRSQGATPPDTMICRAGSDGSLYLKAVSLPPGVIRARAARPMPAVATAPNVAAAEPTAAPQGTQVRRTIAIDPATGVAAVNPPVTMLETEVGETSTPTEGRQFRYQKR